MILMIISVSIKLFILGLDVTFSPEYYHIIDGILGLTFVLPAYLGPPKTGGFIKSNSYLMRGAGGNTGGAAGNTGGAGGNTGGVGGNTGGANPGNTARPSCYSSWPF